MPEATGRLSVPRSQKDRALARIKAAMVAPKLGPQKEAPAAHPLDWAYRYRRIDGRAFSLQRFHPLVQLYKDEHPRIVVMKPAQRGISEWAINRTCYALDRGAEAWSGEKDGLNVAYIFPTQDALRDFSKERFSGLRSESPYLNALFGGDDFNAVTFKQVRASYLYLRGGWSESALLSFSADLLILDEYDRLDPKAIALAQRRLNMSSVRREIAISTPTIPGKGIHALYEQSDKRIYKQFCTRCRRNVSFEFLRDVYADGEDPDKWQLWDQGRLRQATFLLHCPVCRAPWDDAERLKEGIWSAQERGVEDLRGYHIPWWPFEATDLKRMALAAVSNDASEREEFFRSDLGMPYAPKGSQVTADLIGLLSHELEGGRLPSNIRWRDVTMGVDVGARYHYRISGRGPDKGIYVLAMGSAESWNELSTLMNRYKVRRAIVDAQPELHGALNWANAHKKRVYRAFYPHPRAIQGQLYRLREDDHSIMINRTMAMDQVYAVIANGDEHWPKHIHDDPEVITHMTAPVRIIGQDASGQSQAQWVHTAPDHLYHACVYDQVARATMPRATLELVIPQATAKGWGA